MQNKNKAEKQGRKNIVKFKENKGITLVALVITIVILIILAVVTINFAFGESGLITKANEAKIMQTVSSVKETIHLEALEREMDDKELTPETMLAEGKVTRTVQQGEGENYHMYYALKDNAYEQMAGLGKGNLAELKDIFLIDDNLNIKYISKDRKEYGDNIEDKVLDDNTKIRFSSTEFAEYIKQISGAPSIEEIEFQWLKNQTTLTINDKSITSLEDLVFFPNLTSLSIGNLELNSMEGVENCTKLKSINITLCKIQNYEALAKLQNLNLFYNLGMANMDAVIDAISQCENLKEFTFREAQVTNMESVKKLKQVESIMLYGNKITKVEGIENLNNLKSFNIAGNNIEKIDDIVKNTNIENLTAYRCGLTSIEGIQKLTKLKSLDVSTNDIQDITPLASNENLTNLNLKNNPNLKSDRNNFTQEEIEKIDKIGKILDNGGVINLDVNKLKLFNNYTKLDLSNQNLTTLEYLEGLTKLKSLDLQNNQISLEDEKSREILASMTELNYLDIRANRITNMTAVNNLRNLTTLFAYGENNNFNLKDMENLISKISIHVNNATFQTIVNCEPEKVTKLDVYGTNSITILPNMEKFIYLKELKIITQPNISNFEILEKIPNVEKISIQWNNFEDNIPIDFTKFTKLKEIYLDNNYLTSKSLVKLHGLKNNQSLTLLSLKNNTIIDASALLELDPSTKINLKGNVNLTQESKTALQERFGSNVSF